MRTIVEFLDVLAFAVGFFILLVLCGCSAPPKPITPPPPVIEFKPATKELPLIEFKSAASKPPMIHFNADGSWEHTNQHWLVLVTTNAGVRSVKWKAAVPHE